MKSQQATRVDVAIQAGVSQATISRVLNWSASTRHQETRQGLLDAFRLSGNIPHSLTQRFEPSQYSCLTKIYKMVQHHKNLLKSLFDGKGGGDTISFCNIF